jgi:hypothetical protein
MKFFRVMMIIPLISPAAFCTPGEVLEKVTKIQVDPTVIEQPEKVTEAQAGNLVRYNLRAAIKDAHLEEGNSSVRAHIVLDEFSSDNAARRLVGIGSGRKTNIVDGKLVIQDASGKELASVKIHVHGTVAFSAGEGNGEQAHPPTSDLEQRLIKEIESLK